MTIQATTQRLVRLGDVLCWDCPPRMNKCGTPDCGCQTYNRTPCKECADTNRAPCPFSEVWGL